MSHDSLDVRLDLSDQRTPKTTKSRLSEVLNSTVLAAFLTAIVGGVAAQCVVQEYQQSEKEKESALRNEAEQAKSQRAAIMLATDLLAEGYYHAQSIHAVALGSFRGSEDDEKIVDQFNLFMSQWLVRKQRVTTSLSYDFADASKVISAWRTAAAKLETMLDTAGTEYDNANKKDHTNNPDALKIPGAEVLTATDAFMAAVEEVRRQR